MLRIRTLFAAVTAVLLVGALQPRDFGQAPVLEVFYTKLDPKDAFQYKAQVKDKEGKKVAKTNATSAGVFRWEVPETEFGTNGLDRNFTGYCAEVLVTMVANKTYRFRIGSLAAADNYAVSESPEPEKAAQRRLRYIQELFGRYYRDAQVRSVSPEEAVAFQIALWELIQESEPAEGEAKFDLFAGDFQADTVKDTAPAPVAKAQEYLNSLSGNDALYYENPDLRGRELIRLNGIANAEGVVAQSQFALRYAGGGGVGGGGTSAISSPLSGGGLGGVGGGGGGVGGIGGGGGGLFSNPNNGSPNNGNPNTPTLPPSLPPGGGTTNPPTNPPTVTTSTPPVGGPDEPNKPPGTPTQFSNNPVPAPAGLILGAIALGTLASWRLGVKLLAAK